MGNCIVPASSMEWDGEDWGNSFKSSSSNKVFDETHVLSLVKNNVKKEKLLGALKSSCDANGKVRIKISKKEVAELLRIIEKQQQKKKAGGASAEQVLIRLINARHNKDHGNCHHRPWRPVLETVPELD